MATIPKTPDELLREMSHTLGLVCEPQDWGITNADGNRFSEFVTFFEEEELHPTQRFELAELILASANERLLRGLEVEVEVVRVLVRRNIAALERHVDYWSRLDDLDEFPLSRFFRR